MYIYVLDRNKITQLLLPNEVFGAYSMIYRPVNSPLKKRINIEAINNKWYFRSDGDVNAVKEKIVIPDVELSDYLSLPLKVKNSDEGAYLFCVPAIEKQMYKLSVSIDSFSIGGADDSEIYYESEFIEGKCATIYKESDSWYINCPEDDDSLVYLNLNRVKKSKLKIGDVIFIYGLRIIWMQSFMYVYNPQSKVTVNNSILRNYVDELVDNTKYTPLSDDDLNIELYKLDDYFFQTIRVKSEITEEEIKLDDPPSTQDPETTPAWMQIGGSLMMFASSLMMGMNVFNQMRRGADFWQIFPMAFMMVMMLVGSLIMPQIIRVYNKKKTKKKEAKRQKKYREYLVEKQKEIEEKLNVEKRIHQENHPSLVECHSIALSNSRIKWSREATDDDFLVTRIGIGPMKPKLVIPRKEKVFSLEEDELKTLAQDICNKNYELENVPVSFSFTENRATALICEGAFEQSYIDGLILQLITFHSAADLKLVFLINDPNMNKWEYAKFLPHTLNETKEIRFFAENLTEMKTVCSYLEEEFNFRTEFSDGDAPYQLVKPYYFIITNDYLAIKNIPIIDKILNSQKNLGFSFLICESSVQKLPKQCNVFLQILEEDSFIIQRGVNEQTKFKAEYDDIDMRLTAAHLSNIPLLTAGSAASLPTSISFLEMYNVSRIEQLNVASRWQNNNPVISLQASVGVQADGEEFFLDLHEKFHGPHGLVAGTTGSGKSEFLITYLLSMALNYHPYEVQFIIIDYKGGGLAGAFENRATGAKLPHLVGTITNLDVSEMNRTLVSINSELKRRQKVFNEERDKLGEGSMDIYKYQQFYRDGLIKNPMSHLLIVSDEFAELKAQQPEFMDELISAARIGRSLGVHLILATQKPSGVVNDQIWSNSKFKICLKVQDASDSKDMIKRPDAAGLKEAGRFFLLVGFDEYFDIGQSGWAGAKYIPSNKVIRKTDDSIHFIDNTGFTFKTINDVEKKEETDAIADQLTSLVKHVIDVAGNKKIVSKQLWHSAIPSEIFLNDLKTKYNYQRSAFKINPIIGEYDNPSTQFQGLLTLDITNRGNTLIYGMPGAGKENLLSTIIYSTIVTHHPSEVNFYIIDMGAETLRIYDRMPHVGDTCFIDDEEKMQDLFNMISKEIAHRKQLFVEYNGSYVDYCAKSGDNLPSIIVVINFYEIFAENYEKFTEFLPTLYRDGNKLGIYFIVSTSNPAGMRGRVVELFNNKICLQMPNYGDYREIIGAPRNLFPLKVFGRGIVALDHGQFEFQTAYITQPDDINDLIRKTAETFKQYNYKAKRIPILPERVTPDIVRNYMKGLDEIPIGINIETKEIYAYNFIKNKCNVFATADMEEQANFFQALVGLLNINPNVSIRVIDSLKILNGAPIQDDYYFENLDRVMLGLSKEIGEDANHKTKYVYIFIGLGDLLPKLDPASKEALEGVLGNIPMYQNSYFIIGDYIDAIKNLMNERWYSTAVDKRAGLWLGYGVEDQHSIVIPGLTQENRKINDSNVGYAAVKNNRVIFKKIVLEEGESIDAQ